MKQLENAIAEVFRDQFDSAKLIDIKLAHDVDHDGDDILRIEFIFEAEAAELDPSKIKSLIRHLRQPLIDLHETSFPVVRFMSNDEYRGEAA